MTYESLANKSVECNKLTQDEIMWLGRDHPPSIFEKIDLMNKM